MEKVQAGNFHFPNFSQKCPICHGKDCAVRIGFYFRCSLDLDSDKKIISLLLVPIVRFLCKQKQKPKHKHRTFSLLPDTLIPYNRISLDLLMYILQLLIDRAFTIAQTLDQIDALSPDACMMSEKTLIHILTLFEQTRIKLILFFQQQSNRYRAPPDFSSYTTEQTFNFLMKYLKPLMESPHCGMYYLAQEYYNQYGLNTRFLFGTASQFCI